MLDSTSVGPDRSLNRFEPVYVASGTDNSGILTPAMPLASASTCGTRIGNAVPIRVEDSRQQLRGSCVRQQAIGESGLGISLRDVGEGKNVGWIEEVDVRMAVARRLREPMVEAAPPGAGHLRDDAIEDLAIVFAAVEPVVKIGAEESAALGDAECGRARDRAGRNRKRVGRPV